MANESKLHLAIEVDRDALIESLIEGTNRDALIAIIKDIDGKQADWEFTEDLYRYFAAQHEVYEREVKEP